LIHSHNAGSWNLGEPPHEGTQKILNKHNIPFDGMISELFEATDDFDFQLPVPLECTFIS
jgi:protein-tyrosine phosphatase